MFIFVKFLKSVSSRYLIKKQVEISNVKLGLVFMRLFEALGIHEKGIVTAVGAGGKSSLLFTLMEEWREAQIKHLLTTTTKMSFEQVAPYEPII